MDTTIVCQHLVGLLTALSDVNLGTASFNVGLDNTTRNAHK